MEKKAGRWERLCRRVDTKDLATEVGSQETQKGKKPRTVPAFLPAQIQQVAHLASQDTIRLSTQHKTLTTRNIQKAPRRPQFPKYLESHSAFCLDACEVHESNGTSLPLSPTVPPKHSAERQQRCGPTCWVKGSQAPCSIQSHACIFSTAVKSRAHLWMGSSSLGRAGLLNMKQHILQSVVAGKGHPVEQQLWHLKLLALVAKGSLAGERDRGERTEHAVPHP